MSRHLRKYSNFFFDQDIIRKINLKDQFNKSNKNSNKLTSSLRNDPALTLNSTNGPNLSSNLKNNQKLSSNFKNEQNSYAGSAIKTLKKLTNESTKLNKRKEFDSNESSQNSDRLVKKLRNSKNISSILMGIESEVAYLTPTELNFVYQEINYLAAQRKTDLLSKNNFEEFKMIVHTSATFKSLLDRTKELIEELDSNCLFSAFNTCNLIDLDPSNEIVKIIFDKINEKSDGIKFSEIPFLLRTLEDYSKNPFLPNDLISNLKNSLKTKSYSMIMNDQFDTQDVKTVIKFFGIFLVKLDLNAVNHLTKILLSPKIELDFKQSINLLRKIKIATEEKYNKRFLKFNGGWIESLNQLIDKCNLTISEKLTNELTTGNIIFFLSKLHRLRDSNMLKKFVKNYYDSELIFKISSDIISICRKKPSFRFQVFYLIFNLSKFEIYDESLLLFAYESIALDKKLRSKLGFNYLFRIFYEIKFEFIDYENLTKLLFDNAMETNEFIKERYPTANLKYLTEFILFDIQNKNIIDYFDKATSDLNGEALKVISDEDFKHICLARSYLSMFSQLDEELKNRLKNKFDKFLKCILDLNQAPEIHTSYLMHNSKLQANGYLSNGVYIDEFAIYDHSIQDLISLIKFEEYFNRVDQIPLEPNQQLLTFVYSSVKTNCEQYEKNYNLQLKKVLRNLNFEIIDVKKENLLNLSLKNRIDHLISLAFNLFK